MAPPSGIATTRVFVHEVVKHRGLARRTPVTHRGWPTYGRVSHWFKPRYSHPHLHARRPPIALGSATNPSANAVDHSVARDIQSASACGGVLSPEIVADRNFRPDERVSAGSPLADRHLETRFGDPADGDRTRSEMPSEIAFQFRGERGEVHRCWRNGTVQQVHREGAPVPGSQSARDMRELPGRVPATVKYEVSRDAVADIVELAPPAQLPSLRLTLVEQWTISARRATRHRAANLQTPTVVHKTL